MLSLTSGGLLCPFLQTFRLVAALFAVLIYIFAWSTLKTRTMSASSELIRVYLLGLVMGGSLGYIYTRRWEEQRMGRERWNRFMRERRMKKKK